MKAARAFIRLLPVLLPVFPVCFSVGPFASAIENRISDEAREEHFFSYERFFLDPEVVGRMSGDGKVQKDLNRFTLRFTDGIYSISAGRLRDAERELAEAREIWPEYFGTDFLLALVYEGYGDYRTAARYYKSYLNKLRRLQRGGYQISEPLIRTFAYAGIESYEEARGLIEKRLAGYGLSLGMVRPAITIPGFILYLALIIAACGIYAAVYYRLLPYLRRQRRRRNPPEGFWVCPWCDTANPELTRECNSCGRGKNEKIKM